MPVNAPRYAELRRELLSFPAGKHDDIVDALGLVGRLLDRMMSGQKPKTPEKHSNHLATARHRRPHSRMIG